MSEAPTTQERYAAATHSSNLRSSADTVGDADYLGAAGLTSAEFGKALIRLQAEWDSSTKRVPRRPTRRDVAIAAQRALGNGITKVTKQSSDEARERLMAVYRGEVAMLSASLRSLGAVRLHLSIKLCLDGLSDDAVIQIIFGWLAHVCPFCQGRKLQLQKWSDTDLSDQVCGGCGGTGERPAMDDVERSARIYMSECIGHARQGIKRKTQRLN
ncbi:MULTISPECIES: hypothetical protein [Delftia]|uniref:hypothetical protein n=1 Tax=Delftia TaxID=80865 RepID=UPI0013148852|nr:MULTISPECIES: hypothetical protein [Delftia]MXN31034.1 hypothetical protein [Delftia sp. CH05]WEL99674.1 hypothetical protein PW274_05160 [Delftia tsuruhatensis]WQM82160.1 hypothetical protein RNT40_26205 [Delftia tsuruhatensis]